MHSTTYRTKSGSEIRVLHNGDWSGDVQVSYPTETGDIRRVELPGEIFILVSRGAALDDVRNRVIDLLESL